MTNKEISEALLCCATDNCNGCPRRSCDTISDCACINELMRIAADALLKATIEDTTERENGKPPLGVMPRYIWEMKRRRELARAIMEFEDAGRRVPYEWAEELAHLEYDVPGVPEIVR